MIRSTPRAFSIVRVHDPRRDVPEAPGVERSRDVFLEPRWNRGDPEFETLSEALEGRCAEPRVEDCSLIGVPGLASNVGRGTLDVDVSATRPDSHQVLIYPARRRVIVVVGPPARTEEVAVQILIVNFNLDGLSEEEFASSSEELAPAFAAVPGLAAKIWLADRAEGIFGGVYTFESEKAVDDYLQSDLFAGLCATPGLVNISVRRFGVLDGPTRVTRGFAQPAAI
jgi:hypothetical protein